MELATYRAWSLLCSPSRLLLAGAFLASDGSASPQNLLWIDQEGSSKADVAWSLTPDLEGGVFVGGYTEGDLVIPVAGARDACLLRFDGTGVRLWTRQFGSDKLDAIRALVPDGAGGVFACGETTGDLASPNHGLGDAWIARFDQSGERIWARQLGTTADDYAYAAAEDGSGGVFIAGGTWGALDGSFYGGLNDAWIARFDATGDQLWIRQIGTTASEIAEGAASDGAGGVLVCGTTGGNLGGPPAGPNDAWVARIDSGGNVLWISQLLAASNDAARRIVPDGSGGAFVGGGTNGSLGGPFQGGFSDAWIARLDAGGTWLWIKQFGASALEDARVLAPDSHGGAYLGGLHSFGLSGTSWLARYDEYGTLLGQQVTPHSTQTSSPTGAPDGQGGLYFGGATTGSLGGPNAGGTDIFLARYDDSCNSGKSYCVASSTSVPGCTASLTATGSPTLSDPSAWTVSSGPVPGGNLGLLLFGSSGPDNTPYGTLGGKLCVAAPNFRTVPKTSGGDQGQCNGSYAFTLADLIAAAPIVSSGATIHAQVWARDPANVDGFLLSNGLTFTVCP